MATGVEVARALWREVSADNVGDLAAGLSYRFLLALFPFFIFLGALASFVAPLLDIEDPTTAILDRIAVALPGDARALLTRELAAVLGEQRAGLASGAILGALWAAAGGMSATMRAMNAAYDVEETRPYWARAGIAVGLTLLSGLALILSFVSAIAGGAVVGAAARAAQLEGAYTIALKVLEFVLPPILLTIAAAVLFWAAPNTRRPFRWITPGAVLFTATWLAATAGFSIYVANFGSYNATYGALGALVVLMLWFYVSAFMMLVGGELNALLWQQEQRANRSEPARRDEVTTG